MIAFTQTQIRLISPEARRTRMRCRLGRNLRLVVLVTCVPMPPLFFAWPLRWMIEPVVGRLPVIAQILDMLEIGLRNGEEMVRAGPWQEPNGK